MLNIVLEAMNWQHTPIIVITVAILLFIWQGCKDAKEAKEYREYKKRILHRMTMS